MPTPSKKSTTKKTTATKAVAKDADAPRKASTRSSGPKVDLVIVESPAKAKTINKYLGPNYKVLASYGHVRDLATGKSLKGEEVSGIDISAGWKLRYLVDAGRKNKKATKFKTQRQILDELQDAANNANRVLLASDPDREGESIAWHIADELKLDPQRTFRIRFNEITKKAVQDALTMATKIDMDRVKAQEARRAMDRVVGFPLSRLLGEKVTRGLSAGRVQSVAVKLIVDREREIEAFKTEEYWKVTGLFAPQGTELKYKSDPKNAKIFAKKKEGEQSEAEKEKAADEEIARELAANEAAERGDSNDDRGSIPTPPKGSFLAGLVKWDNADPKIGSETEADAIAKALQGVSHVVSKIEQKSRSEKPQPPFTTSTLQQQANIRMKFPTSRTMQTAQKLYEGVDLGSAGTVALITYMRTDSTRVSPDALKAVRDHIDGAFGSNYLPKSANIYASGKSAQEAHEAIRPTDVTMTPDRAASLGLAGDQLRLYTLIWNRFVASQMANALFDVTTVEITAGQGLFRANGKIEKFDGYRKVMIPAGKNEDLILPNMKEKDAIDRHDLFETQHFTQPPPRFNEASLVKQLEKEGIGRPSTYSSIIGTIQDRGYVRQESRRFFATEVGMVVTDLLVKHFPGIMDLKFTSHFEEELDEIERGKEKYEEVLNEFWGPFSKALSDADTHMPVQRGIETGEKCPECGKPLVALFSQKTGKKFIGCSGYRDDPICKYIKPEPGETPRAKDVLTDIPCPAGDGKKMIRKEGRFGVFFVCENGPDCPATMNLGADGNPVVTALPTSNKCPQCKKKNLLFKRSKAGKPYVQCPDTKCKYINDADEKGNPIKPADTGIFCEKCKSPMIIKSSFRGPFLACTGYPKCRNTKSINKDLREQLKDILPEPAPKGEKKAAAKQPELAIEQKCSECDSPMRLQKSRFGGRYFLGCTKYPDCKGTAKLTPAQDEEIAKQMAGS